MKKLILSASLMLAAVAIQASEVKTSADSDAAGCCGKAKTSEQTMSECPMATQAKTASCPLRKTSAKQASTKQILLSPKAASLASR